MKVEFEAGRKFKLTYPDMDEIGEYGRCVIRKRYMSLGRGLFHAFEVTEGVVANMENITDYFKVELIDNCLNCDQFERSCLNTLLKNDYQEEQDPTTFTCANFTPKEKS